MPKFGHKVIAIAGDCTLEGLGLSSSDRELLINEVSTLYLSVINTSVIIYDNINFSLITIKII